MTKDEAQKLLDAAGVFFDVDDDEEDAAEWRNVINLNDTFSWACADGESVTDDELPRVGELFLRYGLCGVYYWAWNKRGRFSIEFADIRRFVNFVAYEETLRAEVPSSTKRAYTKMKYTLGEDAT